jgi:hypothetical protein
MMKVKLLVSRAGVGFSQNAGDVIEVDEGKRLLDRQMAEAVSIRKGAGSQPVVEAAMKPKPKRRAKKKPVDE